MLRPRSEHVAPAAGLYHAHVRLQYAYANTIDLKIPFDLLEIEYNDTLEFMFISAHLGVKEYSIPYEMLLTVPRL